jgi:hypothetical protein
MVLRESGLGTRVSGLGGSGFGTRLARRSLGGGRGSAGFFPYFSKLSRAVNNLRGNVAKSATVSLCDFAESEAPWVRTQSCPFEISRPGRRRWIWRWPLTEVRGFCRRLIGLNSDRRSARPHGRCRAMSPKARLTGGIEPTYAMYGLRSDLWRSSRRSSSSHCDCDFSTGKNL